MGINKENLEKMKYLILGSGGFVAYHYINFLIKQKKDHQIFCVDICDKQNIENVFYNSKNIQFFKASLLDRKALRKILIKTNPDFIIHLAAQSSVAFSWSHPYESFTNNVYCFLNLLEELKDLKSEAKVLLVGSSEEYGKVASTDIPIKEEKLLNPASPYAISRATQNQLAKIYSSAYGLNVICTRSFNHLGPNQATRFVISSFVDQAIKIKLKLNKKFVCGNIEIVRDFIDVRDVINAYECILKDGRTGETYNVCSGKGYKLKEVISIIKKLLDVDFEPVLDKSLLRPIDNKIIIGSNEKIVKETKFKLQYFIEQSLLDMIEFQKGEILNKEKIDVCCI